MELLYNASRLFSIDWIHRYDECSGKLAYHFSCTSYPLTVSCLPSALSESKQVTVATEKTSAEYDVAVTEAAQKIALSFVNPKDNINGIHSPFAILCSDFRSHRSFPPVPLIQVSTKTQKPFYLIEKHEIPSDCTHKQLLPSSWLAGKRLHCSKFRRFITACFTELIRFDCTQTGRSISLDKSRDCLAVLSRLTRLQIRTPEMRFYQKNGYPERFVLKTMESVKPKPTQCSVGKKPVYMRLPFKGQIATFYHQLLCVLICMLVPCIIRWSYDKAFVGQNAEHNPISLSGSWKKPGSSAIASHLAETNHVIDKNQAFTIIYRAPLNRSRLVRSRLVSIAEAIGIRLLDPQIGVQKKLLRPLNLSWPAKNPVSQACLTLMSLT
ncbi:reverse transcriptase [Clonorchis sinensis]|uniref:Reverse transcriptase n=1 Tax=Clonorchis sinensis TaxID=79923 RepID=G7YRT9_CLOSI|nr:reverse transcriptase [Clonorchis sinensis]